MTAAKAPPKHHSYFVSHIPGRGYVVLDVGNRWVTEPSPFRQQAERARDEFQRIADAKVKRGARSCMACERSFFSEGIHNRMCPGCRGRASGEAPVTFGFGAIHRGKRA